MSQWTHADVSWHTVSFLEFAKFIVSKDQTWQLCITAAEASLGVVSLQKQGGICGPWIPDDGKIVTHTVSKAGKMTQKYWTSKVRPPGHDSSVSVFFWYVSSAASKHCPERVHTPKHHFPSLIITNDKNGHNRPLLCEVHVVRSPKSGHVFGLRWCWSTWGSLQSLPISK